MKNGKMQTQRLRKWLYLTSAGILLIGLVSSVLIYRAAAKEEAAESGYEVIGGFVYPGGAYNKKYVHDLQVYGGNAAMLADRFNRWFFGLWHGTSLAYTVAVISLLLAFGLFVAGRNVQPFQSDALGSDNPDKTV